MTIENNIAEFGDNPNLYAVAFDNNTPSTWKFPIFDAGQVSQAIDGLTYSYSNDPKLTPDQRTEAYKRIENRIPQLMIEDSSKQRLLSQLEYATNYTRQVTEFEKEDSPASEIFTDINISEFKGDFPNIPFAPGVDLQELTKDDKDPVFVTLPIAEIGATSAAGFYYDEKLVNELETQVNAKKPDANFGHIKDADRDSEFPIPQALWVGAKREGNQLWAKAYMLDEDAKNYVKKLKAVGGSIATSIYGKASTVKDSQGRTRIAKIRLEKIDFGPKDRVSLKINPQMTLTKEFENINEIVKENKMTEPMNLSGLRKEDAIKLPKEVKEAVLAEFRAENELNEKISEYEFKVTSLETTVKDHEKTIAEYRGREFADTLNKTIAEMTNAVVKDEKNQKRVDAFRTTFRKAVISELSGNLDEKKTKNTIDVLWRDEFQPQWEVLVEYFAGPPAIVQGTNKAEDKSREDLIANAEKLARENGMLK